MRNSTFSLSPAIAVIIALSILTGYVFAQLDWQMINAAIAHQIIDTDDEICENTVNTYADLRNTKVFVGDEQLQVAVDTAAYTYAIYDVAGVTTGNVMGVEWAADTMRIHTDRYFTVVTVGNTIVGTEE